MRKSLNKSFTHSRPETLATTAAFSRRLQSEGVECPKCSKRSIVKRSSVKRSSDQFDCLNCNFRKELSSVSASPTGLSLNHPLNSSLAYRRLADRSLSYTTGHPNNARSPLYSVSDESGLDTGGVQPFVFASLAVIIGIALL